MSEYRVSHCHRIALENKFCRSYRYTLCSIAIYHYCIVMFLKQSIDTFKFPSLNMCVGIVRQSRSIVKCYDEMCGDIVVSDELRKMLLLDDSNNYDVYSEKDRSEFLFRIFKHVCLGGSVCQVMIHSCLHVCILTNPCILYICIAV